MEQDSFLVIIDCKKHYTKIEEQEKLSYDHNDTTNKSAYKNDTLNTSAWKYEIFQSSNLKYEQKKTVLPYWGFEYFR